MNAAWVECGTAYIIGRASRNHYGAGYRRLTGRTNRPQTFFLSTTPSHAQRCHQMEADSVRQTDEGWRLGMATMFIWGGQDSAKTARRPTTYCLLFGGKGQWSLWRCRRRLFLVVNITTFDIWMELLSIPGREGVGNMFPAWKQGWILHTYEWVVHSKEGSKQVG